MLSDQDILASLPRTADGFACVPHITTVYKIRRTAIISPDTHQIVSWNYGPIVQALVIVDKIDDADYYTANINDVVEWSYCFGIRANAEKRLEELCQK